MDDELDLSEWLQLDQSDPLLYKKEVLYADNFEKRDGKGVLLYKFGISPSILDHLHLSVAEQLKNGVEIPYASKHLGWELAENRWGDIVGSSREPNEKGKDAHFLHVRFSNEKTKELGLAANVSVGIPPIAYDGLGRKYSNPLRHLAATSAPVVPGLSQWQAIAASFDDPEFVPIIGDLAMAFPPKKPANGQQPPAGKPDPNAVPGDGNTPPPNPKPPAVPTDGAVPSDGTAPDDGDGNIFDMILQVLEIQVQPGADDNAKGAAILTALQMLKGKQQMANNQPAAMNQGAPKPAATPGGGVQLSQDGTVSPLLLGTIAKNRELVLSQLVTGGKIDSNTALELQQLFGTNEVIGLELSQGGDGSQFEKLVGILSKNAPLAKSGQSKEPGENGIEFSHEENNSGLSKAIDKKVEAAEKK